MAQATARVILGPKKSMFGAAVMFEISNVISNIKHHFWRGIVKSTLFCKVSYVLYRGITLFIYLPYFLNNSGSYEVHSGSVRLLRRGGRTTDQLLPMGHLLLRYPGRLKGLCQEILYFPSQTSYYQWVTFFFAIQVD
jgi:hypothetical protein